MHANLEKSDEQIMLSELREIKTPPSLKTKEERKFVSVM